MSVLDQGSLKPFLARVSQPQTTPPTSPLMTRAGFNQLHLRQVGTAFSCPRQLPGVL